FPAFAAPTRHSRPHMSARAVAERQTHLVGALARGDLERIDELVFAGVRRKSRGGAELRDGAGDGARIDAALVGVKIVAGVVEEALQARLARASERVGLGFGKRCAPGIALIDLHAPEEPLFEALHGAVRRIFEREAAIGIDADTGIAPPLVASAAMGG